VRVTVSILTAETLAMSMAVDVAYSVRLQLARMGKDVELDVLTDSRQLYCALQGHGSVKEKRLMNEVAALRQVPRKKEVTRVGFVRSEYNMAEGLAKLLPLKEDVGLTKLLTDGKLPFIVEEFLPRQFGPCSLSE
jgi:hypothetical protein